MASLLAQAQQKRKASLQNLVEIVGDFPVTWRRVDVAIVRVEHDDVKQHRLLILRLQPRHFKRSLRLRLGFRGRLRGRLLLRRQALAS